VADRARVGARGERAVERHLRRQGFRIEARNWRCRTGELDIVASKGDLVVMVEVRSVSEGNEWLRGSPSATVTGPKQARIGLAAAAWLAANPRPEAAIRFDVVGVRVGPLRAHIIDYIEDAFVPETAW
jgi:putative endonuclease